jgi:hypothetical protein
VPWGTSGDSSGRAVSRQLSVLLKFEIDNHRHAVALHYMYCNFYKVHQTLRVTPAMEPGLTDHIWTLRELVGLLEAPKSIAV